MSLTDESWRRAILPVNSTIEQVIRNLDQVAIKIVLVVNELGKLEGTISDGDVRRGMLKGMNLASPAIAITNRHALVVPPEMAREVVMQLMAINKIHQIPVVDVRQQLVGLHLWDEINIPPKRPNLMVIMAGGKGVRLMPHTQNCPKPMVPIAGKPMLEHIIERSKLEGFSRFFVAIHHLGEMIESYFGDGGQINVSLDYLRESSPLGTAGALSLLNPSPDVPFVVTNADVITDIRYGELLDFHKHNQASATMAVRPYELKNPFGVVEMEGIEIIGFEEKPIVRSQINAGLYALSPEVLDELIANERCDMPKLFSRLQSKGKRTIAYPMHESWLDVGRAIDLQTAKDNMVTVTKKSV